MIKTLKSLFLITVFVLGTTLTFAQEDSRYDAGMNLPFNEKAGDVNPQTGSITINNTDVALPGRAGYNFSFGRMWSLTQANAFNMYSEDGKNRLNSNTTEKASRLGVGWSSTMPYIQSITVNQNKVITLFHGGGAYEVDQTNVSVRNDLASNLLGYDLLNLRIYEDSGIAYNDFDTNTINKTLSGILTNYTNVADNAADRSKYVLIMKSNEMYYFRPDGKVMMQVDKSGLNKIWYFYNSDSKLALVVDSIGREITFSYDTNGNLAKIEWDVTVGTKVGETRSEQSLTRSIEYTYKSAETFSEITALKDNVIDYQVPYLLETVKDQMGNITKYDYEQSKATFTFDKENGYTNNVFMLLTGVSDKYDSNDGSFKNKRVLEYNPMDGTNYKKWFYTGHMEFFKISRQYYIDINNNEVNETTYRYYDENYPGNDNKYTAIVTTGNVTATYTYSISGNKNQDNVLDTMLVETNDGFSELKDYVYNDDRAKVLEEVFRSGEWVYRQKYSYDKKGNLVWSKDKQGLETTTAYHEKFSIPTEVTKIVDVAGKDTAYKTETIINNTTGQVEKQKIYVNENGTLRPITVSTITYDVYGNPVTKTDANGNTIHTVYDLTFHAFPVKIYQDVNIAAWALGDVHTNWQTDPTTTKKVRLRSWKVFNTDGSVWIEVDNEGYAIEHYYDANGQEIERVNPDLGDERGFAQPIEVVDGNPVGTDFDNFKESASFAVFLTSRQDNPGARMEIDYHNDKIITYADINKTAGEVKITGQQGNGVGQVLKEIEYTYTPPFTNGTALTEYAVKEMVYDDYGRMVSLTDPDATAESKPVNINGVKVQQHDKTWLVKYDDLGRKLKVYYPETRKGQKDIKVINYDDVNNIVTTTDPEGRTISEKYDWNGNVVEIIRYGNAETPVANIETITFKYDKLNRKVEFIDAKGLINEYFYDERNLLLEQIFAENTGSDKMTYNDLGQLTQKTDRKGNVITFEYDQLGRNTKALHYTSMDNKTNNVVDHTVEMAYDNRGNAVRISNANLVEHYIYDHANRVVKLERKLKDDTINTNIRSTFPETFDENSIFGFNYVYNDAGMVTNMSYPDGSTHTFSYDGILGRLINIKEDTNNFVDSLAYNKSGVVTRMNYSNNTFQTWDFDNRKRISHIKIAKGSGEEIVDMTYTLNGVGDILKINNNEYGYDGFDRIAYAKTQMPGTIDKRQLIIDSFGSFSDNATLDGVTYNEDADLNYDGRINGVDYIKATLENTGELYDIESFEYDKNGNRTKLVQNGDTYYSTYGIANRLLKVELQKKGETTKTVFAEYEYDANGNTIKRTIHKDSGDEVITFEYDTMNRLVNTTETRSAQSNVTEYRYDNAGNRFIKKTNKGTTVYLRHGQIAVAMDLEMYTADVTTDIGKINRYVLSGDLVAGRITNEYTKNLTTQEISTNISKYWYHLDHLNSTKAVTKEDADLDVLYEYRAFGEELKKLGDGDAKYTYGGKELDSETDLYYFNARYYDATIGRFINVDPVQDGMNWYVYCDNNPINMVDPTGLRSNDLRTVTYLPSQTVGTTTYKEVLKYQAALNDPNGYQKVSQNVDKALSVAGLVNFYASAVGAVKGLFLPDKRDEVKENVNKLINQVSMLKEDGKKIDKIEVVNDPVRIQEAVVTNTETTFIDRVENNYSLQITIDGEKKTADITNLGNVGIQDSENLSLSEKSNPEGEAKSEE